MAEVAQHADGRSAGRSSSEQARQRPQRTRAARLTCRHSRPWGSSPTSRSRCCSRCASSSGSARRGGGSATLKRRRSRGAPTRRWQCGRHASAARSAPSTSSAVTPSKLASRSTSSSLSMVRGAKKCGGVTAKPSPAGRRTRARLQVRHRAAFISPGRRQPLVRAGVNHRVGGKPPGKQRELTQWHSLSASEHSLWHAACGSAAVRCRT